MDYGRESGNVVQIITGGSRNGGDYWGDQPVWATEDEYGVWDREASVDGNSNSNYDGRQSQTRSGSEPPNKKRTGPGGDGQATSRSKAIGKMFFKTKLCCKFRAGTCPYITNCNFAHSIEELRRPPPNWQEIVAAHEEDRAVSSEPREEFQIPSLGSASFTVDSQRSYKGRHCKKFYTEEGCPYGDNCTFLHDEQSKARESVVISLGPGSGGGYGGGGGGGGGGDGGEVKVDPIVVGGDYVSSDVIILDVKGMSCGGCSGKVKRILESQPLVSAATVNLKTETAIVWPVPAAKRTPNWQKDLGEKLAKHLTTCGFNSNIRAAVATTSWSPPAAARSSFLVNAARRLRSIHQ